MKRTIPLLALLAAAGCAPRPQTVSIGGGPRPAVIEAPAMVPEGTELHVVVHDSVYAHAYRTDDKVTTLSDVPRAALFGAASLSKLANGFPLQFKRGSGTGGGVAQTFALVELGDRNGGRLVLADSMAEALLDEHPGTAPLRSGERQLMESALLALLNLRDEEFKVAAEERHNAVTHTDDLRRFLLGHADQAAVLAFMLDAEAHALVKQLAADPLPARASRHLLQATESRRIAIPPDTLLRLMDETESYGRRLATLLVFAPPTVTAPEEQLRARLEAIGGALTARKAAVGEGERFHTLAVRLARRLGETARAGALPAAEPIPPLTAAGLAITRRVAPDRATAPELLSVREDLQAVQRQSERLVATLARLPEWTRGPDTATVLRRRFYGSNEVGVTVTRQPRFGAFTLTGGAAPPPAPKPGGSGSGDKKEGDGEGATPRPQQVTAPKVDTVAVVRVPVLPRFRFQLGAGLMHSPLETGRFDTETDTTEAGPGVYVRDAGTADQRLAPMALLSYTVLPLSGKMFDGRAYDTRRGLGDYLRQAGLAAQLGLSMTNPTEELFFGISTEPLPGLSVGWGYHTAYLETSDYVGQFVPNSTGVSPTQKEWRSTWNAWTLALDAKVFAEVFGSLLK